MKKIFCVIIACLLVASVGWAKERVKPQKFNVTITIEYDDLTIQQLADVEKELSSVFGDAKSIKYSFQKDNLPSNSYSIHQLDTKLLDTKTVPNTTPIGQITPGIIGW